MNPWIRQGLAGLTGLALGALVGFYLTVVVFVAKARAGIYVFSLEDVTALRWEMIPTLCGIVAGVAIGWRDVGLLGRLALAGALVALPFGVAGWFIGGSLWATASGRWAGAVIAVGLGLLVGICGEAIRRGIEAGAPDSRAGHGIEILARAGYAAKGIVYVGTGLLTAAAAFQAGSQDASGSRDALAAIGSATWGSILLAGIAIGMAGYVVWRVVQALLDPEDLGSDAKGLATRAVLLMSALVYGGLGLWIGRRLLGTGGGSGGGDAQSWSATLLQQPFGPWILGLFGAGVMAYGVGEWFKAVKASFEKRLRRDLDGGARRLVRKVARVGLVSRGICFLVIGGFLIVAAWRSDPSQARGLEGALEALGSQPYGPWIMGVVALGLAAYGVLQGVKAWYREVGPLRS